jgi:hypothetical protein
MCPDRLTHPTLINLLVQANEFGWTLSNLKNLVMKRSIIRPFAFLILFVTLIAMVMAAFRSSGQSFSSYVWENKQKYGDTVKVNSYKSTKSISNGTRKVQGPRSRSKRPNK